MAKLKKCKICNAEFKPESTLQKWCSPQCGYELSKQVRQKLAEKQERAEYKALKAKRQALNDNNRSYWLKKAQNAFNAYIRKRDENEPCISCGRFNATQWHAGHYKTTASRSDLRFNENNVHKQCVQCNFFRSGEISGYRINLVAKIGLQAVEELENNAKPKKWTIDELKAIEQTYKIKLKDLNNAKARTS